MKTDKMYTGLMKMGMMLFTFTVVFQFPKMASAQILMKSSVFSNGGSELSGNIHRIIGTVGQSGIGEADNTTNSHGAGFWYQAWDLITSIDQIPDDLDYRLEQNYPNPFNLGTTIEFTIPVTSFVLLKVYDISGREVETLVSEELQSGHHTRDWSAADKSNGVYYYRLQVGEFTAVRKLMLINIK
jgi:hypothetical protein